MPESRVGNHLGDVSRAVDGPLELLRDLCLGGRPPEELVEQDLGPLVVARRGHQQLGLADGRGFSGQGGVHLLAGLSLRERAEVGAAVGDKCAHGFEETEGTFLDEVTDRKAPVRPGFRQAKHHREIGRDQAFLAREVAQGRAFHQPVRLSGLQRRCGLDRLMELAQHVGIAI